MAVVCGLMFYGCGGHSHDGHDHGASSSVHSHDKENDHDHGAELCAAEVKSDEPGEEGDAPGEVYFSDEQARQVGLALEAPRKERLGQVIKTTAKVLPAQNDEYVVVATASGVVSLDAGALVEGRRVEAGATLLSITGGGMADGNISVRYAEAEAEYERAKAAYERKKELRGDKIVSEQEYEVSRGEYEAARSVYENLKRGLSHGKKNITSPIGGYVREVTARPGAYVEAGYPLAVVAKGRDLLLKADVPSRYYHLLSKITTANVRRMGDGRSFTLEDLGGKLLSYSRATGAESMLVPVIFQVRNNDELLPGSLVEIYIRAGGDSESLTVPSSAILEEMGSYFVFIASDEAEHYLKRPVTLGSTDGIRTEVRSGIASSDMVVITGGVNIKLAQGSGALDAHSGHAH